MRKGDAMSDHFKTQYEQLYQSDEYYWGTGPASFVYELKAACGKQPPDCTVLDIGCGEGKDAVDLASDGYRVTAFDITESGIRKTYRLAERCEAILYAFTADINDFQLDKTFDIIYSSGTLQYLREENIAPFFEKIERMTNPGGIVYFNVFVEKPFLPLPPDWDREERMWRTGDLFRWFADWQILKIAEEIFEDNSGGVKHFHCMDTVMAKKPE